MSTKGLLILLGVTVVIVGWASQNTGRTPSIASNIQRVTSGEANAAIGSNALGAATGNTNSSGNPIGGLGS